MHALQLLCIRFRIGLLVFSPSSRGEPSIPSAKSLGDNIQPEGQFDSSRMVFCARWHFIDVAVRSVPGRPASGVTPAYLDERK
jgi:hypothetical protein